MRILHTSDWHLGRRLEGESLAEPHEVFLNWLTKEFIPEHKPDLIVIAGDIFDRPVPPTEAIELDERSLAAIVLVLFLAFGGIYWCLSYHSFKRNKTGIDRFQDCCKTWAFTALLV